MLKNIFKDCTFFISHISSETIKVVCEVNIFDNIMSVSFLLILFIIYNYFILHIFIYISIGRIEEYYREL